MRCNGGNCRNRRGGESIQAFQRHLFQVGQGWTGVEKSPAQSINSAELKGLLREYFYDGQSLRQLANEPLLYGVAACLIIVYLVFMMREEIGGEWRRLRQANKEPEWGGDSRDDWTANQGGNH
jgi:hypothetical protein